MSNYATENLRTLALVGHGSCGKTTLIEAMLYRAGMIPEMGSIQRGTTMCDNDLLEKEVGHSIRLAVAHIDTAMTDLTPVRIHILDTSRNAKRQTAQPQSNNTTNKRKRHGRKYNQ